MIQPIAQEMKPNEIQCANAIREFIAAVQHVCNVDTICLAALMGQEVGNVFACVDAITEKEWKIAEDDPEAKPLKQVFLLNFEVKYNEHRAKHERDAGCVKPEPKIV